MTATMTTIGGYIVVGVIALAVTLWTKKPNRQSRANQQKELRERERKAKKEKESKSRKVKSTGENSGNEAQRRKTKKEMEETGPSVTPIDNSPDEHVDDREFARQLNHAKTGTNMMPKSEAGSRQKSVKLSKAKVSDDDEPRGINGDDGDDDLSSAATPELKPTVSKSGDVSDMLESKTTGPSVLRLTESSTPQPSKVKKPAPKPQPELTKRQRQNKARKENEKVLNEQTEQQRRLALEQQLRTARVAEGRPAKDGSSSTYTPPPPKTNAWNSSSHDAPTTQPPPSLLDTFVQPPPGPGHGSSQAPLSDRAAGAKSASPVPSSYANLPSEEEQLRLLSEHDDSGWAEVKAKKSSKKLPKASHEVPSADAANGTKFDGFEVEA